MLIKLILFNLEKTSGSWRDLLSSTTQWTDDMKDRVRVFAEHHSRKRQNTQVEKGNFIRHKKSISRMRVVMHQNRLPTGSGISIPGDTRSSAGCGSEKPDLALKMTLLWVGGWIPKVIHWCSNPSYSVFEMWIFFMFQRIKKYCLWSAFVDFF